MAKVLQVIDVDSNGHCVRLDDGRVIVTPHGREHPQVGQEFAEPEDADALMVEKLKESHQAEVNEAINVIIQQRGRICDLEEQLEESKDIRTKLEAELKQPEPISEYLTDPLALAVLFHVTYERLAPGSSYETRQETRIFDPESPNGKLMLATCAEVQKAIRVEGGEPDEPEPLEPQ